MDILKNAESVVLFDELDFDKQSHIIFSETLFSFRTERLIALKHLILNQSDYDLEEKILSIRDRKGCLTVFWRCIPKENDYNIIQKCWELLNESQVEHYYFDKLIKY